MVRISAAIAALAVAVLGGGGGCSRDLAGGSVDGATVFAKACATCHGEGGKPSEALATQLRVRDLTSVEFRARRTPALVEHQVRIGSADQRMPAFRDALTAEQIQAVAAFVMTLEPTPAAPASR